MAKRHITVVVSDDQAEMLTQLAAEQGESLSAYVRGRLMARENLEAEFKALQTSLIAAIHERSRTGNGADLPEPGPREETPDGAAKKVPIESALVEVLLHLRALGDPAKNRAIRAEVTRLGFTPFGEKE